MEKLYIVTWQFITNADTPREAVEYAIEDFLDCAHFSVQEVDLERNPIGEPVDIELPRSVG